ncbi:MAG: hypothetical protein LBB65_02200, partial [Burkholderiales bacterium]|nr:hypothetical protein [Burkholderiales bacterium]
TEARKSGALEVGASARTSQWRAADFGKNRFSGIRRPFGTTPIGMGWSNGRSLYGIVSKGLFFGSMLALVADKGLYDLYDSLWRKR